MKAVFTDYGDVNLGGLTFKAFDGICELEAFAESEDGELPERCRDAEIIFTDSCRISRELMESCPALKYIGCAATGYNNVDIEAAREMGIAVTNVPDYSREAVAQHTIALILHITNKVYSFSRGRRPEEVEKHIPILLDGKSMGIVGYGSIGSKVAEIAGALGMTVNAFSLDPDAAISSDIVSLHCPLTEETAAMIDSSFINRMKEGAILINTARGALVDEDAVAKALKSGKLLAFGTDVTVSEPPEDSCPLLECENCFITPHIAFMPRETREKLLRITAENLKSFLEGGRINRIV